MTYKGGYLIWTRPKVRLRSKQFYALCLEVIYVRSHRNVMVSNGNVLYGKFTVEDKTLLKATLNLESLLFIYLFDSYKSLYFFAFYVFLFCSSFFIYAFFQKASYPRYASYKSNLLVTSYGECIERTGTPQSITSIPLFAKI